MHALMGNIVGSVNEAVQRCSRGQLSNVCTVSAYEIVDVEMNLDRRLARWFFGCALHTPKNTGYICTSRHMRNNKYERNVLKTSETS